MLLDIGLGHLSSTFRSPLTLPMCRRTTQWMTMDQKKRRRKRTEPILIAGNASHQGLAHLHHKCIVSVPSPAACSMCALACCA